MNYDKVSPGEETIEVELYPPPVEPARKGPAALRVLGYWAGYASLSYASIKVGEWYREMPLGLVFELGEATIAGTIGAAITAKARSPRKQR